MKRIPVHQLYQAVMLKISTLVVIITLMVIEQNTALAKAIIPMTQSKIKVLLINPSIPEDPFWHKTQLIAKQAAKAFGFELTVIYGEGTRFFQLDAIKNHFRDQENSHDYVILINYPGNAKVTMDFLHQQGLKIITLEHTLIDQEKETIGIPGDRYKNWLGEIYFDNEQAGFNLAVNLFTQHRLTTKPTVVAGISGQFGSESTLRNNGLLAAVKQENVKLTQIVHAGWSSKNAYVKTFKLLQRYPDINVIWCASDHMALGALKAIEELGLVIGKDIFIGGFDWTAKAIQSIDSNKLSASVGGHFMMGAIAMIAIYDIENGIPHQPFVNSTANSFNLDLITKKNVAKFFKLLTLNDLSHIDFKKLAQLYSREKQVHTFNLLNMLDESTIKTHP
jgi:ABC-type sugar transport system substrate-binding protein